MLNKQHRYSFGKGAPRKSSQTPFFVLRYEKADNFTCGVVVSKKVASHAVDRNHIKRMYKSVLESVQKENPFRFSIVFYVRKSSMGLSKESLQGHIEQIFRKEGII